MAKLLIDFGLEEIDYEDIDSILKKYEQVNQVFTTSQQVIENLRNKIKLILTERKWTTYKDNKSKVSATIVTEQKECVNKKVLQMLLNEEQYNQAITKKSLQKIQIITQHERERLKQYGKNKK